MVPHSKTSFIALGALAVALTACGSDGATSDDDGSATTSEDDAPATTSDDGASATTNTVVLDEPTVDSSTTVAETEATAESGGVPDGPSIVIGAQDFGESSILGEVYGQALSDAGYPVEQQALGGYRDLVYTAFESGDINFTAEYAASAIDFFTPNTATGDIDETAAALRSELETRNLVGLDASPAVDSNSFVVTPDTAATLAAPTVSSLTDEMTLGAPPECPDNPSCIPGLIEVYGIDLSANYVPLDGGGPLTKAALEGGEIDVAVLFSTDATIADKGWVVLEDDQNLINADNIIPVTTAEMIEVYGDDFVALLNEVSAAMSTDELTEMNRRFVVDKADASEVAAEWLQAEGLIE